MGLAKLKNVKITGICCAVPDNYVDVEQLTEFFTPKEIKKISNMTGTQRFHRAKESQTTSDLCVSAARQLFEDLKLDPSSIDGIIFVTQTPDYILPATACSVQSRLKLREDCFAFDVSLGCSGYVYGLFIASQFIASRSCKRILLLVGDTISKVISPEDRSVAMLFGDAGSASLIEYEEGYHEMTFSYGTDGRGEQNLIIPAGGMRNPRGTESNVRNLAADGNKRSSEELYMNGSEIFNFTLERVPHLVTETVSQHGWEMSEVDYFILHQANKFMLDYLAKKIGLNKDKVPMNISEFGNTSSASIPLILTDLLKESSVRDQYIKVCLSGFGVGYSWASVALSLSRVHCSKLVLC